MCRYSFSGGFTSLWLQGLAKQDSGFTTQSFVGFGKARCCICNQIFYMKTKIDLSRDGLSYVNCVWLEKKRYSSIYWQLQTSLPKVVEQEIFRTFQVSFGAFQETQYLILFSFTELCIWIANVSYESLSIVPGDLSLHSSPFLNDKIIVKKTCCCQKSEIPGDVSMYFTPNFCAKDFPAVKLICYLIFSKHLPKGNIQKLR